MESGAGYLGDEKTLAALVLALLSLSILAWAVSIRLFIAVNWSRFSTTLHEGYLERKRLVNCDRTLVKLAAKQTCK